MQSGRTWCLVRRRGGSTWPARFDWFVSPVERANEIKSKNMDVHTAVHSALVELPLSMLETLQIRVRAPFWQLIPAKW